MQISLAKKIFAVSSAAAMVLASLPFVALAAVHSAGTNVVSNGTVYFINGSGQKQPYTSAGAFLSYGFNSWSGVMPASAEDLALPTGAFVPAMDGSLINDHGTVYLITGGQKAGFTSASNFLGLGYSWNNVIPGDVSFMSSAALVNSTTMAHPAGTLVNDRGTVYLMSNTGKMGIPTLSVFNSWGYSFGNVVPANSYDSAVAMSSGVMQAMVPGQLSPLGSTGTTPPPATGSVSVSLTSDTPAAGSIAKSAKVNFTRFNLTAGSSGATISQLIATRLGLSSDSDVSNVYLYNVATGAQLAVGSLNSGKVTFNISPALTIAANSTVAVGIRADMAAGGTTGDSIGYGIAQSSDVAGASGSFPVNGNLMTIAAVSNLGALTITSPANVSSQINAGTLSANVGYFQFAGANQPLSISSIKFTEIGSIANNNLANFKLLNGATQVGTVVPSMATDNTVTFNLAGSPLVLPSGQTANVWLQADIVGGATRTVQFTIQRTSDVTVNDTTYNTGIVPGLSTATGTTPVPTGTTNQVTVAQGTATISVDSSSPTGNVATGALGVPLATFTVTAAGEDIRFSQFVTSLNSASGGTVTNPDLFKNGKLIADATVVNGVITGGTQIGSTQNINLGTTSFATTAQQTTFSIPGYWTVPAGTTHKLTVAADMVAGTTTAANLNNAQIAVQLVGSGITAQGASSLQTITFANTTARTLTISSGGLTSAVNNALVTPTAAIPTGVPGQGGVRISSFTLTAGASEAVNLTQLTLTTAATTFTTNFQNLVVKVNGTMFGTSVGAPSNATNYTFSPSSPVVIPAGGSVVVDVYADILSGATTGSNQNTVTLASVTATGVVDNLSMPAITTQTGQTVWVSASGTLTVTADAQAPTASQLQQLPMGTPQQTLAVFNLAANQAENINITKIVLTDTETATNSGIGDLANIKLYVNGTAVCNGLAVPSLTTGTSTTGTATFNLQSCPIVVPVNSNISVYVKADISQYPNAVSGATHQIGLASAAVTSLGAVSGVSAGTSAAVTGVAAVVYKTALTVSKDPSSPSGLTSASATQTVAIVNFSNATNAANQQVTLFPKVVASPTTGGLNTVALHLTFASTIPMSTTARTFKIFKASDLTNAVATVTLTPSGLSGSPTWSGDLTLGYTGSGTTTPAWTAVAAFVGTVGTSTVTPSAVTLLPQTINSGATQQYVMQFDTSDASSQKSFTVSIPTSQAGVNGVLNMSGYAQAVWSDGFTGAQATNTAGIGTLNGTPVTFGTLSY